MATGRPFRVSSHRLRMIAVGWLLLCMPFLGEARACSPQDLTITANYASGFLGLFRTEEKIEGYAELLRPDHRRLELALTCDGLEDQVQSSSYQEAYESRTLGMSVTWPKTVSAGQHFVTTFDSGRRTTVFLCDVRPLVEREKELAGSAVHFSYACADGFPEVQLRWQPALGLYLCSIQITRRDQPPARSIVVMAGFSVCESGHLDKFVRFGIDLTLALGAKGAVAAASGDVS